MNVSLSKAKKHKVRVDFTVLVDGQFFGLGSFFFKDGEVGGWGNWLDSADVVKEVERLTKAQFKAV